MDLLNRKWIIEILWILVKEGEVTTYQATKIIRKAKYAEIYEKFTMLKKYGLIKLKRKEVDSKVAKYWCLTSKGEKFLKDATNFIREKMKEEIEKDIEIILTLDENKREFLEELKQSIEQKLKHLSQI